MVEQNSYRDDVNRAIDSLRQPKLRPTHLNVRYVPEDTLYHLKLIAAIERKSVKQVVLEMIDRKIEELEAKGHLIRHTESR